MITETIKAYLQGAFHDGTSNRWHRTFRFCQKEKKWLEMIQKMFRSTGYQSWIYKEGKERNLYVLETTASFLREKKSPLSFSTSAEKEAYIRGYFDAEGGIPSQSSAQFYIQFSQKNRKELIELQTILRELGIESGRIHNPSVKIDPLYFRFFVSAKSFEQFMDIIFSWHPRKQVLLNLRMKI